MPRLAVVLWALVLIGTVTALKHSSVVRSVDLTSQLSREVVSVTVVNDGTAPTNTYQVTHSHPDKVAHVEVVSKETNKQLPLTFDKGTKTWTAQLTLAPSAKAQLVIRIVSVHDLLPLPAEINQLESQYVKWTSNANFYTPYESSKSRTVVQLPQGSQIISKTEANVAVDGSKLTYGTFNDVAAFDQQVISVHFENNSPFVTIEELERSVEVSHWGNNLAVDESFSVVHSGAKLRGPYSRIDQMKAYGRLSATSIVESFDFTLPADATDVYYWDIIGNISTSNLRQEFRRQHLHLEPRYPLLGGWRTKWAHGYNQPLSSVLFHAKSGSGYVLRIPFVNLFENAVADHYKLKFILPEGSHNIEIHSAVPIDKISTETVYTYLDSYGRPVLVVEKSNVVNEHAVEVFVTYDLADAALYNEPLLLFIFFISLFFVSIIYVRIDLSIAKDANAERRERVRAHVYDIIEVADDIKSIFRQLDEALARFKSSKDSDALKQTRSKLEASLKERGEALSKLHDLTSSLDKDTSKNIDELRRLSEEKLTKVKKLHSDVQAAKPSGRDSAAASIAATNADIATIDKQFEAIVNSIAAIL